MRSIEPVLVLQHDYTPFRIVDWKRAFVWMACEKATVVEWGENEVHSPSKTWSVPSVIRMCSSLPSRVKIVRFSRNGVWARDKSRCQYCGRLTSRHDFTLDHVVPRAHGGGTTWTNVVTCCFSCNQYKGSRSLDETDMMLINGLPSKPSFRNIIEREILRMGYIPETWHPYLPATYDDLFS